MGLPNSPHSHLRFSLFFPRAQLRKGLSALPEPKRNYEIVVPEVEEEVEAGPTMEEDAAAKAAREAAKRQAEAEAEFRRASQAVQRGLPLPRTANRDILRTSKPNDELQEEEGGTM